MRAAKLWRLIASMSAQRSSLSRSLRSLMSATLPFIRDEQLAQRLDRLMRG